MSSSKKSAARRALGEAVEGARTRRQRLEASTGGNVDADAEDRGQDAGSDAGGSDAGDDVQGDADAMEDVAAADDDGSKKTSKSRKKKGASKKKTPKTPAKKGKDKSGTAVAAGDDADSKPSGGGGCQDATNLSGDTQADAGNADAQGTGGQQRTEPRNTEEEQKLLASYFKLDGKCYIIPAMKLLRDLHEYVATETQEEWKVDISTDHEEEVKSPKFYADWLYKLYVAELNMVAEQGDVGAEARKVSRKDFSWELFTRDPLFCRLWLGCDAYWLQKFDGK
jgi:hypothetical protein